MSSSSHRSWLRRHPDLLFWGCFLGLNALLFLPFYLLNIDETSFFPFEPASLLHPREALVSLLLWRENGDPFRLNVELVVLLALWINVGWIRRGFVRWSLMLLYFVALLYYVYESIMLYLYKVEPIFYNHFFLIRDGLAFLLENLSISATLYVAAAVAVGVVVVVIQGLVRTLVDWNLPSELSRTSRVLMSALAIAVSCAAVSYRYVLADPRIVVSSLAVKLERNIEASVQLYQAIANFDDQPIRQSYRYDRYRLAQRPNVYLIFVESYGSVLYKRPDYLKSYTEIVGRMRARLEAEEFSVASALSESPTWGGGSWLAYTSTIFGLRIDTHPQYLSFLERYQDQTVRYPDLGTYLRNQGYRYQWVTPLSVELKDDKWEEYQRFYGTDSWFRYRDLAYDGPEYGWGPAPPDQYVLNYTRDELLKAVEQPLFLFYITQNSHYPWDPRPTLATDWRDLDKPLPEGNPEPATDVEHQEMRANYLATIDYSLNMLTDFVLDHKDEDAVFVLVGDHQPPRVSRRNDGYDTPIHVISRDAKVIENLAEYGFVEGTLVDPPVPQLRHEGLYSLLVRTLVKSYGVRPDDAPAYLPNGVLPPAWVQDTVVAE